MENVGQRIKRLRESRGLSAAQLARLASTTVNAIFKIEGGYTKAPEFVAGLRMARALGVDPWYLAFGEGTQDAPGASALMTPAEERLGALERRVDEVLGLVERLARDRQ